MKLTKLIIHKYRNVAPGTSLHFSGQRNVLLGRNGTGKTTLLNLVAAVVSSDFSQLRSEEFSIEYEIAAQGGSVRIDLKNERGLEAPPVERISDKLGGQLQIPNPSPLVPRVRADFSLPSGEGITAALHGSTLEVDLGKGVQGIKRESMPFGVFDGSMLFNLGLVAYRLVGDQELMQRFVNHFVSSFELGLVRFDESLGFLGSITDQDNIFVLAISWDVTSFYGRPRWHDLMLALKSARDKDVVEIESREWPWFEKLLRLLGFVAAQVRLERIEKKVQGPVEEIHFGNMRFNFLRSDGSSVVHTLLSYGQKRLLAFYSYLESCGAVVVADELVNGLHHAWIEACLDAIGDRQAFLTSQNPLLVDYLGFDSVEEVRSSFILCRSEVRDGRETLVWSNMTEEDAQGFFSAYQVGIQHVSEILRTRGLW